MLKPRYRTIGESVSDFNNLLEDMNKTQPLEHHKADQEVRARQEEERLRRELNHVENVIAGSGHFFTEREMAEWYQKRASIAEMLGEEPGAIEESWQRPTNADPAINSRYESSGSALERFRVLSGIQEQTAMPRDAGIFGSTRHNANYDEIADQTLSESVSQDSSDKWRGSLSRLDESKKKDLSENVNDPTHGGSDGYHPQDPAGWTGKAKAAHDKKQAVIDKQQDARVHRMKQDDAAKAPFKKNKLTLRRRLKGEDTEYQEGSGSRRAKADRQIATIREKEARGPGGRSNATKANELVNQHKYVTPTPKSALATAKRLSRKNRDTGDALRNKGDRRSRTRQVKRIKARRKEWGVNSVRANLPRDR
jgi:hypothetical protein